MTQSERLELAEATIAALKKELRAEVNGVCREYPDAYRLGRMDAIIEAYEVKSQLVVSP